MRRRCGRERVSSLRSGCQVIPGKLLCLLVESLPNSKKRSGSANPSSGLEAEAIGAEFVVYPGHVVHHGACELPQSWYTGSARVFHAAYKEPVALFATVVNSVPFVNQVRMKGRTVSVLRCDVTRTLTFMMSHRERLWCRTLDSGDGEPRQTKRIICEGSLKSGTVGLPNEFGGRALRWSTSRVILRKTAIRLDSDPSKTDLRTNELSHAIMHHLFAGNSRRFWEGGD